MGMSLIEGLLKEGRKEGREEGREGKGPGREGREKLGGKVGGKVGGEEARRVGGQRKGLEGGDPGLVGTRWKRVPPFLFKSD